MKYYHDSFGWLTALENEERSTLIAPPSHGEKIVGQPYPNWTGAKDAEWSMEIYTVPVAAPAVLPVNPWDWFIDVGPFMDRFGAVKLAVLLDTQPVVQALVRDMQSRKWIDLKRADVAAAIMYMRGVTIPGMGTIGTPIAGLTANLQTAILTTPVSAEENMALKKLYFS